MECQICQGEHGHLLHPFYSSQQHSSCNEITQLDYHQFYGTLPVHSFKPWAWYWHYRHLYTHLFPHLLVNPLGSHTEPSSGSWPEGFVLRGELRWGKLQRVFGASQELPVFVKEDLRRVYGTYPSTAVNITYHSGEFVVRGDPRVGEQEYRVEKKLVRQIEGCHDEDKAEKEKKKTKKGK